MRNVLAISLLTIGLAVLCTSSPAGSYGHDQNRNTLYRGGHQQRGAGGQQGGYGRPGDHHGNQARGSGSYGGGGRGGHQGQYRAAGHGSGLAAGQRGGLTLGNRAHYGGGSDSSRGGYGARIQHQPLGASRGGSLGGGYGGHQQSPSNGVYRSSSHYESKQSESGSYGSASPQVRHSSSSYGSPLHGGGLGGIGAGTSAYSSPLASHGRSNLNGGHHNANKNYGREMKYTVRDPYNKGTTHVTETHIVSNREMHGAEAEAAMKRLMGNMGPGSSSYGAGGGGGFQDLVKGVGLPYF